MLTIGDSYEGMLANRIFRRRLELICALDDALQGAPRDAESGCAGRGADRRFTREQFEELRGVRDETAEALRAHVGAMDLDDPTVRPHRQLVEKYLQPGRWSVLTASDRAELARYVARLPTTLGSDGEEAQRFDLRLLGLQVALMNSSPSFELLGESIRRRIGLLARERDIPQVRDALPLILEVQGDAWWKDVTAPMLEHLRKELRPLAGLIERWEPPPIQSCIVWGKGTGDDDGSGHVRIPDLLRR